MPKKAKIGKGRLDKYYHLAKDQGYRARSAFKLIQLAKKHDFLSKAKVCIDLCAAPGGWSQVAQRNMPASSIILAVDLVPIKPIHGVTCIQSDITSDKCRSLLKKEMKGQPADIVLHDGAPNVGSSWAKDAYGQAELTLHSLKLACEHLRVGGTFVTKVFRSADYNSLMWVFSQLFGKVDATKPTASRNVSAEIFVMCIGFKAGKIEPKFFDPKWVFMETVDKPDDKEKKTTSATLTEYFKSDKKKHRSGYEEGDDNRIVAAHDFVAAGSPAEVLVTSHQINLDAVGSEDLVSHPSTTGEIREICRDLKVCGKGELSALLKWRMKIVRERERAQRAEEKAKERHALAVKSSCSIGLVTPVPAGPSRDASVAEEEAKEVGRTVVRADVASTLQGDVADAISALLDEGDSLAQPEAEQESEAGDSAVEEELDRDLAELVEKRRREEKRDAKKTMTRQKKQEWRKKMSLANARQEVDQPELFKSSKRSIKALEDQDHYIDPRGVDSDREESDADGAAEDSASDSDEGLDRLARMEVDLAVDHQLRRARLEDKCRTKMQRIQRKKKETRRERVMAAWAGEMGAFNEAIEQKAAEDYVLKDKEEDEEADEDDDGEDDGDEDLKALRDFQSSQRKAPQESGYGGMDPIALEALAAGPSLTGCPRHMPEDGDDDPEGEKGKEITAPRSKSKSSSVVPLGQSEEALRAEARAQRWFSQDIFQGVAASSAPSAPQCEDGAGSDASDYGASPEDFAMVATQMRELSDSQLPNMPLTDKQKRQLKRKREEERKGKSKEDEDNRPVEVAPMEAPKPLVPASKFQKPSDPQELAETLALGSLLVDSKKSRMDIIDAAYNRWTFDADEGLPDWFTEDENKHNKPELPISKDLMDQFRAKLREINARPIRKVTEAKARKRRRLQKRLEKLRSTAMSLADVGDMSETAKARQMRKAMSKAVREEQRKVSVVAIKKGGGGRNSTKGKVPKGAKVKVVDKRMKSDRRGEKKAADFQKKRQKTLNKKLNRKRQAKASGGGGGSKRESGGKGVFSRGTA